MRGATGLGYMGVDAVVDVERGPLIMEVNARPGLEIQNVNGIGLAERLEAIGDDGASNIQESRGVPAGDFVVAQRRV